MQVDKTDADAAEFAKTLADDGDASVFSNLWARGEYGIIRGHFPAFFGTSTEAVTAKSTKPSTKSKK